MKTNLWAIVFSIAVILMVSIQGLNENRIGEKDTRIEQLENHIAELNDLEAARIKEVQDNTVTLTSPMDEHVLTSECGIRKDPMGGELEGLHNGIDMVGPSGAKVKAAAPGTIADHWLVPGWHNGVLYKGHPIFGGCIVIDHGGGVFTLYGHLKETEVHIGDEIKRGQVIGIQGSTGISTGEHLHFEVIYDPVVALEYGLRVSTN